MPRFDSIEWGMVTIDGKKYDYDIAITPKGELKPRTSESEKFGSHAFGKEELEKLREAGAEIIIIGIGTNGMAELSGEAEGYAKREKIEVVKAESGEAIEKYNQKKIGAIIHITC